MSENGIERGEEVQMNNKSLEAHEFSLHDIFCDKYVFHIPGYQRPYSWEVEHAQTLIDDLIQYFQENPDIKNAPPYFLGSIVLIKQENDPKAEVIDGQQRLTTLTILFSVLRTLVSSEDHKTTMDEAVFQKGNQTLFTDDKPRLLIKESMFFREYVQDSNRLPELFESAEVLKSSKLRIKENAKAIFDKLKHEDESILQGLCSLLMLKCYLVVVTTKDIDSAYRIFSVMNDRGMDLGPTDILKPILLSKLEDDSLVTDYTEIWQKLEDDLGREDFINLFSYIRMIELRAKSKSNVINDYKKHIIPNYSSKEFIDQKLIPYKRAFSEIENNNLNISKYEDELNEIFYWLSFIDNKDWVPVAIYFLKNYRNDPDSLLKFFSSFEMLVSVMMINRVSINQRISRFSSILNQIDRNEVFSENSNLHTSQEEKDQAYEKINGHLYLEKKIRLMVLLRLNSELSENLAFYRDKKITIEHVMPQNPKDESCWRSWVPDKEVYEDYLHRIGNLALISRNKNSSANNYEFEKKKTAYFECKNGRNSFVITNDVIAENRDWTVEVIKERQKKFVDKLSEVWGLK
jgi:uncharacterized protein with ParB-like and HNH nuclease domain